MIPRSFFIALFSILVIESNSILAQDLDSAQAMIKKIFSISGEIGTYGELYSIAGQPERRPKSTGRIFFRPVLNLFNLFQIPFEFFISSEGSSAKQNINHFGINPSWDWGILHLGDFTNEFSNYTLSGINIRGAGVDIKPGLFRLSIASGFTQRSVPGGAQDGSFKRFLFSAKLGLGKDESTFVDLIFLRAKDELSSLNQNTTSITIISPNGNDVLEIGTLQTIRWNSFNLNSGIKIEISRDGGNSYELLADQQPNVGFFNWMVTPPATFNAIIRLSSVADSSITDVSDNIFTLASGVQSQIFSNIDDVINENAVLPQENLVVGTKGRIVFADNIVSLEFDGAGSIYTRDIRSSELDSADIPDFLTKIFKPRTGTNYDFAFNTSLNLNLLDVNTKLGYKRIGPGYNSLGTSYLLNDIQEYSIFNSFRISKTAVNIIYIHQNDNLLTQKQFTTARNIVNAGINTPIYSNWIAGFSVNFIKMENNAADSIKTDFNSLIFNTNHNFLIDPQGTLKNINLNYSFQTTDNKSYNLINNTTTVHTLNLGSTASIFEKLNCSLNVGIIGSSIYDTVKTITQNYGLTLQHNSFESKWLNTASINFAKSGSNSSLIFRIGSSYQISLYDLISFTISYMKFNGSTYNGSNFTEVVSGLNYSHRF